MMYQEASPQFMESQMSEQYWSMATSSPFGLPDGEAGVMLSPYAHEWDVYASSSSSADASPQPLYVKNETMTSVMLPPSPTDAFSSLTSSPTVDQWMDPTGLTSPLMKLEHVDYVDYASPLADYVDHASPLMYAPHHHHPHVVTALGLPPSPTSPSFSTIVSSHDPWAAFSATDNTPMAATDTHSNNSQGTGLEPGHVASPATVPRARAYSAASAPPLPMPLPATAAMAAAAAAAVVATRPRSVSESHASATLLRPYRCHTCHRSFARKHDLERHVRVHTGEKPYPCLCCKKAFARTDALKRHLRMEEVCRTSPEVQAMKDSGKRRYRNL